MSARGENTLLKSSDSVCRGENILLNPSNIVYKEWKYLLKSPDNYLWGWKCPLLNLLTMLAEGENTLLISSDNVYREWKYPLKNIRQCFRRVKYPVKILWPRMERVKLPLPSPPKSFYQFPKRMKYPHKTSASVKREWNTLLKSKERLMIVWGFLNLLAFVFPARMRGQRQAGRQTEGRERERERERERSGWSKYKMAKSSNFQVCLFVGCLTSQQHASVSQVRVISRVSDQNGVSQAWYIVEKHHSGWEPSINALLPNRVLDFRRHSKGVSDLLSTWLSQSVNERNWSEDLGL